VHVRVCLREPGRASSPSPPGDASEALENVSPLASFRGDLTN
jgi:hypothetical protein